jgi:hypothetical protein
MERPNLNQRATRDERQATNKNAKRTQFHPQTTNQTRKRCRFLLPFFPKKPPTFPKKSKKIQNKRVLQILDINTLNSMCNKDLHNYFNPECGPRSMRKQRRKIQNEPNFTNASSTGLNQRETSHERRATKKCKTNPI